MAHVFNSNTVLARELFANTRAFDRLDEIPQPRIVRLDVRLSF